MRALLALALLAALSACAPPAPAPPPPAWLDHEGLPDGLGAVGAAPAAGSGAPGQQRDAALADARVRLAGKLEARVRDLFTRLNLKATEAALAAHREPVPGVLLKRVTDAAVRQVVDRELPLAAVRGSWTDPAEGTCFVFLAVPKDGLSLALRHTAQAVLRQEGPRGDAALERLVAALALEGPL